MCGLSIFQLRHGATGGAGGAIALPLFLLNIILEIRHSRAKYTYKENLTNIR